MGSTGTRRACFISSFPSRTLKARPDFHDIQKSLRMEKTVARPKLSRQERQERQESAEAERSGGLRGGCSQSFLGVGSSQRDGQEFVCAFPSVSALARKPALLGALGAESDCRYWV